jgi:PAS domain S-box-containing protein
MKIFHSFSFLFLSVFGISQAQPVVLVDSTINNYNLNTSIAYYFDESAAKGIKDVLKISKEEFTINDVDDIRVGFVQSALWMKIKIKSTLPYRDEYIISFKDPSIYKLEMYIVSDSSIKKYLSGVAFSQNDRQLKGNRSGFKVSLLPGKELTLYFRAESVNKMTLTAHLQKETLYHQDLIKERVFLGIFYGVMLMLLFYNSLMFVTTRLRIFAYYGAYVLFVAIFTGAADGMTGEYLHFFVSWKDGYQDAVSATISNILGLMFMLIFLDVNKWSKTYYRVVIVFMIISGISCFVLIELRNQMVFEVLIFSGFIQLVLLLIGSIRAVIRKVPQSGYYLVANLLFSLFIIIFILNLLRIVPYIFIVQYSIHLGYGLSVIVLSYGLGARIYTVYQKLLTQEQEKQEIVKQKNEELEEQVMIRTNDISLKENNLRAIIDNHQDSIWLIDDQYNLIDFNTVFNQSWRTVFGKDLIRGINIMDQIPIENLKSLWKVRYDTTLDGKVGVYQDHYTIGESPRVMEIRTFPIFQNNKIRGISLFSADITDREEAQKQLTDQNKMLIKVNQELDRFVYSASHDLKAPLASILGLINLAKLEDSKKDRFNYFSMMETSISRLDQFIKDIIDYSRNARIDIENTKIEIKDIINNAFEDLKYINTKEKVNPIITVEQNHDFISDHLRIKMIVRNILTNALKYGCPLDRNNILEITAHINKSKLILSIKDYGPGIDKAYHGQLFDMFFRANETTSGTGLGLYIVKEAVVRLGGKIQIDSENGNGAEFIVEIPNKKNKLSEG